VTRFAPLACIALTALAGGCLSPGPPGLAIEYDPGKTPKTFRTPYAAVYELTLVDEREMSPPVIDRVFVKRQSCVGFVREPDGVLVGYAGGRKLPLPEQHFRWQIAPESKRSWASLCRERAGRVLRAVGSTLLPAAEVAADYLIESAPDLVFEDTNKKHPHESER
jgi:hypothetical protein